MVNEIEFLHDSYQERLRNLAQVQSETYEQALEKYRDSFIAEIILIRQGSKLISDKNINKKSIQLINFIREINIDEVVTLFNSIIEIYEQWIDSKGQNAMKKFEELLERIEFEDFKYDLRNNVLFRGRYSQSILTPWDMFHIPFNKRYLIGNQRYSLTGQPLLYLGFSVLDVLAELDSDYNEFDDVKLCPFKLKEDLRVFDLRNEFYKYFKYNPLEDLLINSDYNEQVSYNNTKNEFFKFILASVCSFEKRQEHRQFSFCEEYVLPQMLAQIIKKKGFNGIIYCSTKLKNEENDRLHKTGYKDNVAIFTNFSKEHVYDRKLYSNFKISNPINNKQIRNISIEQLKELCDNIKSVDSDGLYKD
ncbi:MAG: hypothetical protein ACRDA5_08530, partial [Clostridium sp.]